MKEYKINLLTTKKRFLYKANWLHYYTSPEEVTNNLLGQCDNITRNININLPLIHRCCPEEFFVDYFTSIVSHEVIHSIIHDIIEDRRSSYSSDPMFVVRELEKHTNEGEERAVLALERPSKCLLSSNNNKYIKE